LFCFCSAGNQTWSGERALQVFHHWATFPFLENWSFRIE
jgi:hypothetical protein